MGLDASAELVFGLPVYDQNLETYEPTIFWSEENEDWTFYRHESGLHTVGYGHYEDPDARRGILTLEKFPTFSADCWDPRQVDADVLQMERFYRPELWEAFRVAGITREVEQWIGSQTLFPNWHLVASFG
jgi:hypothetical protein